MIKRQITAKEALAKAEALCAAGERCRSEIMEKLRRWGMSGSDAVEIIDSLVERRFVDEMRYAGAFVRSKFRYNHWGRVKIAQALAVKRIPRDLIESALSEIDPEEYAEAVGALARRKISGLQFPLSHEDAAKVARSLMSRGFEWNSVKQAIKDALRDEEDS